MDAHGCPADLSQTLPHHPEEAQHGADAAQRQLRPQRHIQYPLTRRRKVKCGAAGCHCIALNSAYSLLVANSFCFSKHKLIVFDLILHDDGSSKGMFVFNAKAEEGNILMYYYTNIQSSCPLLSSGHTICPCWLLSD